MPVRGFSAPTATQPPPGAFNNATFVYDGDGRRVKSIFNNNATTTYFVGTYYEVTNPGANQTITKYYYAGAQRIAMRTNSTLNYLLGDHLGSTSLITDSAGNKTNEQRYKAWGETRYTFGNEKTKYQYTGQFSYESDFGLMYYGARWYDPSIGRFNQPDTIIPPTQGIQAWDRYAYTNNNPVKYTDPSGHFIDVIWDFAMIGVDLIDIAQNGLNLANGAALAVDVVSAVIPGIPAVGGALLKVSKAANAVDNVIDTVNAVDNVVDTANAVDNVVDTGNAADNLADLGNVIGDVCSFSADTQVSTQEGSENISAIEIGDYVLAWNEADGTLGYYEVTAVFSHADEVLTELIIDGEHVGTTPEHPFYTGEAGWLPAEELKAGMRVRQADGTTGTVWLKWNVYKTQEMYNLTVGTAHTFFVGEGQWLVHNECLKPYEVGLTDDLYARSTPGDGLDIHHAPQKAPASQVIPGYDPYSAPGIALPHNEHVAMNGTNIVGPYNGTASDLLTKTLNDLRDIGVPEKSIRELYRLYKTMY